MGYPEGENHDSEMLSFWPAFLKKEEKETTKLIAHHCNLMHITSSHQIISPLHFDTLLVIIFSSRVSISCEIGYQCYRQADSTVDLAANSYFRMLTTDTPAR